MTRWFVLLGLVVLVGHALVFRTDSVLATVGGLLPVYNALVLLLYAGWDYVRQRRRIGSVDDDVAEAEALLDEGDRLAREGEYDAAREEFARAVEVAADAQEVADQRGLEGRAGTAADIADLAATKREAATADAKFDGVEARIQQLRDSVDRAERLAESESYAEALAVYDDVSETLGELTQTLVDLRLTDETSLASDDRLSNLQERREDALVGRENEEFDRYLELARSAGERGDDALEADDRMAAIEAYEEGIEACEDAIALTDRDGVGDRRDAEVLLEDLQGRRGEAVLADLGERLDEVPSDPGADDLEAAVERTRMVLEDAEDVVVGDGQERDRELVARDAAVKLVAVAQSGIEDLIDEAAAAFEADDHETARDEFDRGQGVAERVLETVADYDVADDGLRELSEVCEHSADAARRAKLGIGDGTPSLRRPGGEPPSSSPGAKSKSKSESKSGSGAAPRAGSGTGAGSVSQRATGGDTAVDEVFAEYPVPETIPTAPDLSVEMDAIERSDQIGAGGNADVTLATVETAEGPVEVALKEPRFQGTADAEEIRELVEEAETWAKIDDHDHVVGVVDWSEQIGWIALEYMDAGDLSARAGDLELPQALWTAHAVTRAVRHAHRRGIQHYDLKPENVLFRSVGDAWDVPKVTDWGLARHLLEHSGTVEGYTPTYAAPEQLDPDAFGDPDERTDVYQLGVVFYELFTGEAPFEGTTGAVVQSHLEEQPAAPSSVADLPEVLDEVVLQALAKDKHERQESVLYLRDGLLAVARDAV